MILFILGLIVVDYVYTATRKRDGKVLHKGVFSDYINDGRVSPTCIIKKAVIQSIAGAQKLEPEDISVELIRQTPR